MASLPAKQVGASDTEEVSGVRSSPGLALWVQHVWAAIMSKGLCNLFSRACLPRGKRDSRCCVNTVCKGLRVLTPPGCRLIRRAVWQLKDVSQHCEAAWKPRHVGPQDKGTQVFEMQKYFDLATSFFKGKK